MRKLISILLVFMLALTLGCSALAETASPNSKILVAYFSRAGENYNVGIVEKGSTQFVAEMIAEETGADLFRIETVTPYPEGYEDTKTVSQQEYETNARPELTASVEHWDEYDVIFLGYPIWWADMPMAMYTFLESYDFNSKTVIPFDTHAGSGLAGTEASIAEVCIGAEMLSGLAVAGTTVQNDPDVAREAVSNWLQDLPDTIRAQFAPIQ